MIKYATFFGGAINDTTTKEYSDSILIGELLSSNNYIVKNGGYRGLMEAVSKGVKNNDGYTIGFTCKTFGFTKGNEYLTQTVVCNDIYDRLRDLIKDSEVFIVQRGGIGTLSEMFLLLDEIRKSEIKPIVYVFGEQWKKLFNNLNDFMNTEQLSMITLCEDYNDFKIKFKNEIS